MTVMETAQNDWVYFTATDSVGPRLIVRRNGPAIQLLTASGWVDRPQLLLRFQDPGFLEEVPLAAAQTAAVGRSLNWPAE
jgi:hypothetical protein